MHPQNPQPLLPTQHPQQEHLVDAAAQIVYCDDPGVKSPSYACNVLIPYAPDPPGLYPDEQHRPGPPDPPPLTISNLIVCVFAGTVHRKQQPPFVGLQ